MELFGGELPATASRIGNPDVLRRTPVDNDEMIAVVFSPMGDCGQCYVFERVTCRADGASLESDQLRRSDHSCQRRAMTVRRCQFAEPCDRDSFAIPGRDCRKRCGAAVG